jgi:hypothetical protein
MNDGPLKVAGRVVALGFVGGLLVLGWSPPVQAFHVLGINIPFVSIDSGTRTVDIVVGESTVGTGSIHSQALVKWGDGASSNKPWTQTDTTTSGHKLYFAFAAHVYPDLTDRTIQVFSDCCNASFVTLTATAPVQLGCADAPIGGCLAPTTAILQVKNNTTDDAKDQFQFKWLKGSTGSVTLGQQYFVCLYAPGLVFQAVVPTGFTMTGSGILHYKDKTGAAGGMTNIKVKPSLVGKGQVLVKGKGANLDDPAMPLTQPVTVQVQNSAGQCWGHQFTSPETKNTLEQFKDKEP